MKEPTSYDELKEKAIRLIVGLPISIHPNDCERLREIINEIWEGFVKRIQDERKLNYEIQNMD